MLIALKVLLVSVAVAVVLAILLWLLNRNEQNKMTSKEKQNDDNKGSKQHEEIRPPATLVDGQEQPPAIVVDDKNIPHVGPFAGETQSLGSVSTNQTSELILNQLLSQIEKEFIDSQFNDIKLGQLKVIFEMAGGSLKRLEKPLNDHNLKLCKSCMSKVDPMSYESCSSCGQKYRTE